MALPSLSTVPLLSLILLASPLLTITVTARTYPDYCTTREQQLQRKIPSLPTNTPLAQNIDSLTLKHVTTIIRHGARTPWASHTCWDGYNDPAMDTSTWECKLTQITRPQSQEAIDLESLLSGDGVGISDKVTAKSGRGEFFQFQKLYDANWSKDHPNHFPKNMMNELRGNCQIGQLIYRGHAQQLMNGKILQEAYFQTDMSGFDSKPDVGVLYDFNEELGKWGVDERAYDEPYLYFRSDDDERTMMSGQLLLEQVFGDLMKKHEVKFKANGIEDRPTLRVHTADRAKDVLAPNPATCPRLTELRDEAMRSEGYREKFLFSDDAKLMKKLAMNEFGGQDRMQDGDEAIDCIMTTLCEDKTAPYVLDVDQSGSDQDVINTYGANIVDKFIQFNMEKEAFVFKYRNNLYSKISTNPLWNDILAGLLIYTKANENQLHKAWPDIRPESKFALYSAHDTTIMSLLASLGSIVYDNAGLWPPYASMVNIELFEINWKDDASSQLQAQYPTGMAFRLLYNGKVITQYVSGCMKNEDLCDIDLLVLHVYPFSNVTEWEDECRRKESDDDDEDSLEKTKSKERIDRDGSNVLLYLLGGLLCMVIGAFVTFLYMSKFVVGRSEPVYDNSLAMTQTQIESDQKAPLYGLTPRKEHHDII